jgi:hypothetical protein
MPNIKIADLPAAGPITGTELVPIVQEGITVRATTAAVAGSPSQQQTFLTLNQEPTLPNSRALTSVFGIGLTDNGAQNTLSLYLQGAAASLNNAGTGFAVKTGADTVTPRSLTVSGSGLSVTNGDGQAGNPTFSLTGLPLLLAQASGTGLLVLRNSATLSPVSIVGTNDQIDVSDGSAAVGSPIISLASDAVLPGTGAVTLPKGSTAQQPVGNNGQIRFNTDTGLFEGYSGGSWSAFSSGAGVVSIAIAASNGFAGSSSGGTTPTLTLSTTVNGIIKGNGTAMSAAVSGTDYAPATSGTSILYGDGSGGFSNVTIGSGVSFAGGTLSATGSGTVTSITAGTGLTGGTITTSGTIAIDSTVATLTGSQILTNKTINGPDNTLTNIANSSLSNSSVTYNGVTVALGASGTITASTPNNVTFNNGGSGDASGTTFNGSAAKTISYNTVGASPLAGSTSLTTVGTITTGVWNGTAIGNSYLANSSVTIGTTAISLGSSSLTLGGLTSVAVTQDPASALQLATKQYVDAVAEGLHVHAACAAATTGTLASITGGSVTYNNGTAGVGATLTLGVALTTLDGYSLQNGDRVLVKNEATQANNGIYTWATGGTVLTRATDFDTSTEIASGDFTFITNGTLYANTGWVQTNPVTTVGTDPIVFIQFSGAGTYTAGTGLTLTGSQFSITNTGVSASTYGSASSVPVIAVNAQGQITSASNSSISINGNQITSGTVGSSYISGSYTGITGVGTLTAGTWNATPIGNSYLANSSITVNGSSISLGGSATITANTTNSLTFNNSGSGSASGTVFNGGTAYTISYNTVGASPLAGSSSITTVGTIGSGTWQGTAIGVGYGGTGLTSYTTGDLLYASGTTTLAKLALGTTNYVLTAGASAPQYVAQSTLAVGSATNATNVALTASSTNADYYLPLATGATTNNYGLLVSTGPTVNPSTGKITNGISGGTF